MKCKIEGCEKEAYVKGMCDMHRKRLARHGHTEQTRPADWGQREKHELYSTWTWIRSTENSVVDSWQDFWTFVNDVGIRPSPKHKIQRIDPDKPYSKSNFIWGEVLIQMEDSSRKSQNAWHRTYRQLKQDQFKGYDLKKRFKISKEDYDELFRKQNGVCAICSKPETQVIRGKVISLAVDHCHEGDFVRGLLCVRCNTGIGSLGDSLDILQNAIEYLRKFK